MANFIDLREINKLIKESFYIPTYQRGYRWKRRQIEQLLEDVDAFIPSEQDKTNIEQLMKRAFLRKSLPKYQ